MEFDVELHEVLLAAIIVLGSVILYAHFWGPPKPKKRKKGSSWRGTFDKKGQDAGLPGQLRDSSEFSRSSSEPDSLLRKLGKVFNREDNTEKLRKREQVCKEIIASERKYIEDIRVLHEEFLVPISEFIKSSDKERLLSNTKQLLDTHQQIETRFRLADCICKVFLQVDLFPIYERYINDYTPRQELLEHKVSRMSKYKKLLDKKLKENKILQQFLIRPVLRIPQYVMLARRVKKYTPSEHPHYEIVRRALRRLEQTAKTINESKGQLENLNLLQKYQEKISGLPHTIIHADRRFIMEGKFRRRRQRPSMLSKERDCHLYLFSDIIICANAKNKFKSLYYLDDCEIQMQHREKRGIIIKSDEYPDSLALSAHMGQIKLWSQRIREARDKLNELLDDSGSMGARRIGEIKRTERGNSRAWERSRRLSADLGRSPKERGTTDG